MRAAVAYEVGQPLVVEEVTPLPVGPRDVLVRVAASGICQTDLSVIDGRSALPLPIVPGHEACGVVEEVGARGAPDPCRRPGAGLGLARLRELLVALRSMSNRCELGPSVLTAPRYELSDGRRVPAVCGCGAFGEAMVVHEASLVAVETDLADEELALLGCGVTTGLGAAFNTAGVVPGSVVAVIGCGAVGQSVIQSARLAGAVAIVAVDPRPSAAGPASGWAPHTP